MVRPAANLYRSQDIAYWFLRLNGFFTIANFVVHPVLRRHPAETDGDLLGVRFPNRLEMRGFDVPLIDHPVFTDGDERVDFVIAEVKHGPCALNDTWTNGSRRVIQYTLDAAGIIDPEEVEAAAVELYARGQYDNGEHRLRLFAFGSQRDADVKATQLTWPDAFGFIYRRFWEHRRRKSDHGQWGPVGGGLFDHVQTFHDDEDAFVVDALKRLI